MSTLTIRNLDESLKTQLRLVAAQHGHSMEEEVRTILRQALSKKTGGLGLGSRIHQRFKSSELALEWPDRGDLPQAADFAEDSSDFSDFSK